MLEGGDMIVNLMHLPTYALEETIKIKRAFAGDKDTILSFIRENFHNNWACEAEHAILQEVSKCFIATEDGKIFIRLCLL